MHYCLRGPGDQVVGLQLHVDQLGHDIYAILDWADEHFESYSVEQRDGYVHLRSSHVEEGGEIRKEPLKSRVEGAGRGSAADETDPDGGRDDDGSAAEPAFL